MTRVIRGPGVIGVAMLAALGAALFATPDSASAHARYKSSIPGKSEVVATAPAQVEITFTEEIQKISRAYAMSVTDSKDAVVSSGAAVINEGDRTKMSVALTPGLAPGRYVVHWNNVSDADGDPFAGAFAFYVATQPTAADQAADAALAEAEAPEATNTAAPGATAPTSASTAAPSPSAAATKEPSTGAASPTAAVTPSSDGGDEGSNRTGLIAGIVVVAVVVVAAGGGYVYMRQRGG